MSRNQTWLSVRGNSFYKNSFTVIIIHYAVTTGNTRVKESGTTNNLAVGVHCFGHFPGAAAYVSCPEKVCYMRHKQQVLGFLLSFIAAPSKLWKSDIHLELRQSC